MPDSPDDPHGADAPELADAAAEDQARARGPLLSRRKLLAAVGGTATLATLSSADETTNNLGSGSLVAGQAALDQAYHVAGGLYIGPESAKADVAPKAGRYYLASDSDKEFYGNGDSWAWQGVNAPSVQTDKVSINNSLVAITDASEAQSIIDSVAGSDAVAWVPPNTTLTISQAWELPTDTNLRIDGTIKLADGADDNILRNKDLQNGNDNITIWGTGELDGNKANQNDLGNRDNPPSQALVRVQVTGTGSPVMRNFTLDGLEIHHSLYDGLFMDTDRTKGRVVNFRITNNEWHHHGTASTPGDACHMEGRNGIYAFNECHHCNDTAGALDACEACMVVGNVVWGGTDWSHGFTAAYDTNFTVYSHNTLYAIGDYGIRVGFAGSYQLCNVVSNNTIYGTDEGAQIGDIGIQLDYGAAQTVVDGNGIYRTNGNAIKVTPNANEWNRISNNQVHKGGARAFYIENGPTILSDNTHVDGGFGTFDLKVNDILVANNQPQIAHSEIANDTPVTSDSSQLIAMGTGNTVAMFREQKPNQVVMVNDLTHNTAAEFFVAGSANSVTKLREFGGSGNYTTTAGNSGTLNLYWSSGNSVYQLGNQTGTSPTNLVVSVQRP